MLNKSVHLVAAFVRSRKISAFNPSIMPVTIFARSYVSMSA